MITDASSIDLKPGGSTGDECTTINTTLVWELRGDAASNSF